MLEVLCIFYFYFFLIFKGFLKIFGMFVNVDLLAIVLGCTRMTSDVIGAQLAREWENVSPSLFQKLKKCPNVG